ncbi:MAG: helix-turn-helix domain-containing protein [Erysipelotrichaceae bacterium]|jgi:transcriptional regulator with XRE-family HTH domain|nr:helix-turn-helix domain-containing protein [Erysipelotrichaceae bacterium]
MDDTLKKLGERIRLLRIEKGWSQEFLSFEADVNKNYISDLERGRRNPTVKLLIKLAEALEVKLVDLL